MRIAFIGLIVLLFTTGAAAQDPWPQERPDDRQQTVLNEDGGRSYIVKPAAAPIPTITKPGTTIGDVEQYSIFLGPGWSDPALRGKEAKFSKLLSQIRDHAQWDEIARAGVGNMFAPTWTVEKLDVTGNSNISDLEIQRV